MTEEMRFTFCCRPLTGDSLVPQVSRALEQRTELLSREACPELWHVTDWLNEKTSDRPPRSRKPFSIALIVMGVFLLVPGLTDPRNLLVPLLAGIAGVAVGLAGLLRGRKKTESAFDAAAEKLLDAYSLTGIDQSAFSLGRTP